MQPVPTRSRRRVLAASLLAAAVLGGSTVAVAVASPAGAAPQAVTAVAPGITVSKTAGIDRAGETLTVTGTGFDAAGNLGTRAPLSGKPAGVYVVFGKFDDTWQPSIPAPNTPPSSTRRVISQVWALPEPSYTQMGGSGTAGLALMQADGSFSVTVDAKVDARPGNYGIYTYPGSGAVNAANETATPVTFAPGIKVSKTANLNRAGETITVTGDGISTTGNLGTRAPLAGKPAGVYVVFGKFDDAWKPSTPAPAPPSSSRRVISQVWALPEPSYTEMGGANTAGLALLKADGSFSVSIDAKVDARPGNYGVYTFAGSGAVNAANEFAEPVTFAPGVAVSKTTNIARTGENITVTVDGISTTGNLGGRAPLAGKPAGAYVVFGKFDDPWQPSIPAPNTPPSSTRRVIAQVWALPEPSYTEMGGANTAGLALLKPDGSVSVTLPASRTATAGNYGVYVYPGSGAVNAANEFAVPVSFAVTAPTAPTIGTATAAAGEATVTWTAPADDGGSPITGYVVTPVVDGTPGTGVNVPVGTSATIPAGNGIAQTFTVAAVNAIGTGPASAASNEIRPEWYLPWTAGDVALTEVFTWLTGKAPTATERADWTADLEPGDTTVAALVASLRSGSDAVANVDPTTRLYSAYLTRIPDKSGLDFWLNRRRNGWTLYRISSNFAASNEFKTRYGTLTNEEFVQRVYQNVLGRDADPSGLAFWTNRLNTRRIDRGQLMINFSESNEYKVKTAKQVNAAVVYLHLLGRAPTVVERDAFVDALTGGATLEDLVADLIATEAFATRAG